MLGRMETRLEKRATKLGRCVARQVRWVAKQRVRLVRLSVGCIS
jgi:hypothetical protein